jgi:hypothetical protein
MPAGMRFLFDCWIKRWVPVLPKENKLCLVQWFGLPRSTLFLVTHIRPYPTSFSNCLFVCLQPLVSGAALGLEGQISVYHDKPGSPCYRCMFPVPPVGARRCADAGVLGVGKPPPVTWARWWAASHGVWSAVVVLSSTLHRYTCPYGYQLGMTSTVHYSGYSPPRSAL